MSDQQNSPRQSRRDEDVNRITSFFGSSRGGLVVVAGLVVVFGFLILSWAFAW